MYPVHNNSITKKWMDYDAKKNNDTISGFIYAMKKIYRLSKSRSLPSGLVKEPAIVLLASQGELTRISHHSRASL